MRPTSPPSSWSPLPGTSAKPKTCSSMRFWPRTQRAFARRSRSIHLRLRLASDSGLEQHRRVPVHAGRPRGRRAGAAQQRSRHAGGCGPQAARDRQRGQHLPRQRAHLQHRHEPGQAADPGRAGDRRLQHAANISGRSVRERLQPLQPHLAGADSGRARVSQPAFRHRPFLRAQRGWQHGAAGHAGVHQAHHRPRSGVPLQPLSRRPDSGRAGAGRQLRPGRRRHGKGGGRRRCPPATATNGPAPPISRSWRKDTRA